MRGILLALLGVAVFLAPAGVLAVDHGQSTVTGDRGGSDEPDATTSAVPHPIINISRHHFVLIGDISAMSAGSLVVNGRTVLLDPTKVHQIVEDGTLKVGTRVHVEGVVLAGSLYAREINVQGEENEAATSATTSAHFHTLIRSSGTPAATGSAAVATTLAVSLQSATSHLTLVLDQILNFLHSLFH